MTGTRTTSSSSFSLSFYQYYSSSFFPGLPRRFKKVFRTEQNFSIFILSRDNIIAQGNKGFMDGDGRKQAENKNPDNIIAGAAAAICPRHAPISVRRRSTASSTPLAATTALIKARPMSMIRSSPPTAGAASATCRRRAPIWQRQRSRASSTRSAAITAAIKTRCMCTTRYSRPPAG